ncbi:MAG: hypothetical protein Greene041679_302 [Parcubacteria group bacterium Greene0416_79]|nr:MAG: hypothetical protein Greene041679_302 [Parcubacteria group bacterium Greene0416_79]
MSRYRAILILALALVFLAALAPLALAQIEFTPLEPLPGTGGIDAPPCTPGEKGCKANLSTYLRGLYNLGIGLAGLFLVFAIVRGGFELMFTDSILGKLEGKKIILQALGGAVIVYSSYLLLNTFNPQLARDLDLSLKFPRPGLVAEDTQLLSTYAITQKQWQDFQVADAARTQRLTARIAEAKAEAVSLRAQAAATTDEEKKAILLATAAQRERQTTDLELARDAGGGERRVSLNALRSQTRAQLNEALTAAGTEIPKINSAFETARGALANEPAEVAESHFDQMKRIGAAEQNLAIGIIENPPLKSFYGPGGISNILDHDTWKGEIKARMDAIMNESRMRANALVTLNSLPTTPEEVRRRIPALIQLVKTQAGNDIKDIKTVCREVPALKQTCKEHIPDIQPAD